MSANITRRALYCLLLCLLLAACGGTKLAKLSPGAAVLAFGDSLTFGTGATPEQSYPSVLAGLIGHPVVNAGVPGETTADGKLRLATALDEHKPALLILCMGGNDFLHKLPLADAKANLAEMIALARSRQIQVLLVGTPQPGIGLSVPAFYSELAKEFKLPLEDEALAGILGKSSLKSDLIHPNAAGYRQFAEAIAKALSKAGAI